MSLYLQWHLHVMPLIYVTALFYFSQKRNPLQVKESYSQTNKVENRIVQSIHWILDQFISR